VVENGPDVHQRGEQIKSALGLAQARYSGGLGRGKRAMQIMRAKEHERPSVTVDVVVVARLAGRRSVLLVKRRNPPFEGLWAIPGGFVEPHEPLEMAARRELREETGLELRNLEQLAAFGDPGRDPRGWTISIAFLVLLGEGDLQEQELRAGTDAAKTGWFGLRDLPPLAFDHAAILASALCRLDGVDDRGNQTDRLGVF
jgi:8-oxo-dGTP diphosphatase